jgi:hypothetical protein
MAEVNGHIFFSDFRCDRAKETQFILAGQKTSTTICKGRSDIHGEHLYFRPLKPSGYHMYHLLQHTKTQHPANTVYLCVSYRSHSKQLFFPLTSTNRLAF